MQSEVVDLVSRSPKRGCKTGAAIQIVPRDSADMQPAPLDTAQLNDYDIQRLVQPFQYHTQTVPSTCHSCALFSSTYMLTEPPSRSSCDTTSSKTCLRGAILNGPRRRTSHHPSSVVGPILLSQIAVEEL